MGLPLSLPGGRDSLTVLTSLGIAGGRLVAGRLRGMPLTFSVLGSSDLTRAEQTADELGKLLCSVPRAADPPLEECTPRTEDSTEAQHNDSEKQLDQAFAKYFVSARGADDHVILVCHGNVIRYFVLKAHNVDPQAWTGFTVAHGSLTIIQIRKDGSCKVLAVGGTGHIPSNLSSGLTSAPTPELVAA